MARAPQPRTVQMQHPQGGTVVLVTEQRAAVLETRGYARLGTVAPGPTRKQTTTRQHSAPAPARKPAAKKA